jgi:REP element-mobilizing transposase RayT
MTRDPHRGHDALRRGRSSQPGATYFLTLCTENRAPGLTTTAIAERIITEAHALTADTTWRLISATVMPDHVHLLITLGERLSLEKSISRLKAKTSALLNARSPALIWQRGFFDHKLRAEEPLSAFLLYIYLNPYRAQLCERTAAWPWFHCRAEEWIWFKDSLDADLPQPEWLTD